ncbi:unnamed protein product [Cylindrotheca closterium]|uniref:Spp2/MOS2 G-patch domain-containing protein n=1 Tax=Cylindrotheca closterium TaxID=2856 RepID=A0AAD2CFK1_9STRA|nr:unnamed protein product [Cylindrotheca closterium]
MTTKPKLAFSLKTKKKSGKNANNKSSDQKQNEKAEPVALEGFEAIHDKKEEEPLVHPDLQGPLVIPALKDSRATLQEQARARREQEGGGEEAAEKKDSAIISGPDDDSIKQEEPGLSKEDQEAIQALKRDAGDSNGPSSNANKRVIQAQENTFQNSGEQQKQLQESSDQQQLKEDLERHAPDLSVDSESYQKVPIADFGAALLRGMGWDGRSDVTDDTGSGLPRPSRLGLGATPKLLDAPTHRKGRRRQDQVQREQRLKEQQEEFEKQRELQIKKDKQQTIQVGSIVFHEQSKRAIIRQWNGVPGLNMILVQFEGSREPTKVKKGSVQLIDRKELQERPFQEMEYHKEETQFLGQQHQQQQSDDNNRIKREDNHDRRRDKSRSRRREDDHEYDYDNRQRGEKRPYDDDRRRSNDRSERDRGGRRSDDRRSSSRRDDDHNDRRKRHRNHHDDDDGNSPRREEKRSRFQSSSSDRRPQTWLTPNIRVRVITSKFGRSHDKRKGVVVDVASTKGATIKMERGEILQVPERYLETALPKVGGNAIILTGTNKFAKGRLLERDSRSNKGAVQLFEDMNIVNTSLDDIAEWCLPLDDDLMD